MNRFRKYRRTGNRAMTPAESSRVVRSKEGACVCCTILHERGELDLQMVVVGCDYNHTKSGNIRRGHGAGFALCRWHHERHPWGQYTHKQAAFIWGVSLKDGSRLFHETYGSDDELIEKQTAMLGDDVIERSAA